MLLLIEIIFTCWLILLPNGDAFCYCGNEIPVVPTVVTTTKDQQPAFAAVPLTEPQAR